MRMGTSVGDKIVCNDLEPHKFHREQTPAERLYCHVAYV